MKQLLIINQIGNVVIGYCWLTHLGPLVIEYNGLFIYRVINK
jgi:hypothetical protein